MKSNKLIIPGVLLLVGLLVIVVALASWFARPEWRTTPAGALILIGAALGGVLVVVKNLIDIINGVLALIPKIKPEAPKEPETPSSYKTPYSQYFYDCYCKAPGKTDLSRAEFDQALWAYLDWVKRDYNQARLYAERPPRGENLPVRKLEEVFIPLTLRRSTPPLPDDVQKFRDEGDDSEIGKHRAYLRAMERRKREGDKLPMKELLTISNRLAIIGGAGCGKSTLAAYLAYSLAEAAQTGRPLPYALPNGVKTLLPILVPLRSYRYYQREHQVRDLHAFIIRYINDRSAKLHLPQAFFERLLQTAPCLLILDGLDEVVTKNERETVRERIEQLARSIYPTAFFIITAREAGYQENAILGDDFSRLDVQDLEDGEIVALVNKWCKLLKGLEDQAEEISTKIREINQRYTSLGLPPLIATPLMVTMVVSARWAENTELPKDRAKLYELVVKAILSSQYTEQQAREEVVSYGGPWEHQRQWLSKLALEMHQGGQAGAAIPESRVRAILGETLPDETVSRFIEAVRYRGSLFEERDELFQFVHLTFQEFLAARYIFHQKDRLLESLDNRLLEPWWREVLLLVYGYARIDDLEFAQRYLVWLSSQPDRRPERLAGLELAGAALLEVELPPATTRRSQAQMLAEAIKDKGLAAPAALRARAGDTLAQLGDPRFDPDVWYLPRESLLGFVTIHAGTFLMGSDPDKDEIADTDEQSQHEVHLPTFYIARYPVTVAQFRSFVEDSGYQPRDEDSLKGLDNHPVVWVSWYEALEYCRWLHDRLSEISRQRLADSNLDRSERVFWEGLASERLHVTLPSEAEWEKAARGTDGQIYPWGNEFDPSKANTVETGVGNISAVGCFPGGASPYGVLDMSGNVWEWTRSKYEKYPYQAGDGREDLSGDARRVLRGGSFYDVRWSPRCALRYWNDPSYRNGDVGFRVVVSPS